MFLDNTGTNSTLNIPLLYRINLYLFSFTPLGVSLPGRNTKEVLSKLHLWLGDTDLLSLALGAPVLLCTSELA